MKYMLMFVQTDGEAWERLSPTQQNMPAWPSPQHHLVKIRPIVERG